MSDESDGNNKNDDAKKSKTEKDAKGKRVRKSE
jgi:hypothetical protein